MRKTMAKIGLLATAVVAVVFAFVWFNDASLPEGPVPVVWDAEVCTNCKMHVGDPRFAAQLQTENGEVLNFDDPGCLFDYLDDHDLRARALYFRDHGSDRWLSESEAGFIAVEESPMGYGIAAVPKSSPDARDSAWAKERVRNRRHQHDGGM
jgi:copper chaperone NosL